MKSKLLKKDYNQELEEIVESKGFEKEVQNLLLSMLYKVEIAYKDYKKVKKEVPNQDEFLQNILDVVNKYCAEIEIAKPNTELEKQLTKSKCKILEKETENEYKKEQKVIIFPNEKVVLYSIIRAGIEKISLNLSLEDKALLTAIQIGKCIAYSEVLRDFNGYSWSITTKEIESIECNIIYNDLIYILGHENVDNINEDNISKLKNILEEDLYNKIKKVAIAFYLKYDEKQKSNIDEQLNYAKNMITKMNNQKNFVEEISEEKKNCLSRIMKIDEMLNNAQSLRNEYIEVNKQLPNEKKIFSVSHYEELLQKERKEKLEKIEEYNKLQNPIEFIKIKNEMLEKINYYKNLNKPDIVETQESFIQLLIKKFEKIEEKEEILDALYIIRYLKAMPISQYELMKQKIDFTELEKIIIKKAIIVNLISPISNNEKTDYILLKSIFDTRAVSFNDFYIKLLIKEGKLISEIYDGEMLDSTNYVELPKGSNIQLRKTKKVKIFD